MDETHQDSESGVLPIGHKIAELAEAVGHAFHGNPAASAAGTAASVVGSGIAAYETYHAAEEGNTAGVMTHAMEVMPLMGVFTPFFMSDSELGGYGVEEEIEQHRQFEQGATCEQ